jgi:hypothetical protein
MTPTLIRSVYHAAMPKDPLIKNPAKRRLVIAIAMGALLVLSLTAAALISGAGLGL